MAKICPEIGDDDLLNVDLVFCKEIRTDFQRFIKQAEFIGYGEFIFRQIDKLILYPVAIGRGT